MQTPPLRPQLHLMGGTRSASLRRHAAFTLLEVILAIAILAISLAAIGEVVRTALGNASQAADGLEARLVAQGVIDQIKCGVIEIVDAGPLQLSDSEAFGNWTVQILVETTAVEELVQVRVLVGRTLDPSERPACELVRWFPNPQYAAAAATTAS